MALFDGKLKQRLVGASVLIIVAVVFIPIILDNKGARLRNGELPQDISIHVPTPPAQPTMQTTVTENTNTTPNIETSHTDVNTTENVSSNIVSTAPIPSQNPPITEATTITSTVPTPPRQTVSKPSTASNITPTWSVQLVALTSRENADKFKEKLRASGYNAYIRTEGKYHRVFVGPVIDKNEAVRMQQQLYKQFKEKGIVREAVPEKR